MCVFLCLCVFERLRLVCVRETLGFTFALFYLLSWFKALCRELFMHMKRSTESDQLIERLLKTHLIGVGLSKYDVSLN